jgi:hypothetical protein
MDRLADAVGAKPKMAAWLSLADGSHSAFCAPGIQKSTKTFRGSLTNELQ